MKHKHTDLARKLRWQSTPAERRWWEALRRWPLGYKFRRQLPFGPYIVDFACCEAKLIIEVDGAFHANVASDITREAFLRSAGWEVARYWNRDIQMNLDGVLADIEQRLSVVR